MSDLNELKALRSEAYVKLIGRTAVLRDVERTYRELKAEVERWQKQWRDADYQISLLDGRRTVVEPGRKGGPPPKEIDEDDLTEQQIINILKAMGAEAPEPAKTEEESDAGESESNYGEDDRAPGPDVPNESRGEGLSTLVQDVQGTSGEPHEGD